MYHRVARVTAGDRLWYYSVSPEQFSRQMECLAASGYRAVVLSDLAHDLPSDDLCVVLTFDDGYRDVYDIAFPILQQHGFRATVFLVSDWLHGEHSSEGPYAPLLSAAQIQEMAQYGVEYGSHGCTHCALAGLSPEKLEAEIAGSRDELQQTLGLPVTTFAYPYGIYDERVRLAVHAAGYTLAVATSNGTDDPLALFRWEMGALSGWLPLTWLPLIWKPGGWPHALLRAWRRSHVRRLLQVGLLWFRREAP